MSIGIRTRTLFTVIVPLLALAMIMGFYFIGVRIDDARKDLEMQGERYTEYLAAASEFNVIAGNKDALEEFAESNMRVGEQVLSVLILNDSDEVIVSAGDRDEIEIALICFYDSHACDRYPSRLFFNQVIESPGVTVTHNPELAPPEVFSSSIEHDTVGRVLVSYNTDQLQVLQRNMLYDGLAITAGSILIASLIALFFAEGISKPISRLSQVVNAIQRGNLAARTIPTSRGELRHLEDGVNAMATWVEEANTNLQQQVSQATSELLLTLEALETKNKDLEQARTKAEEANRTKDLFLARMSHELRTPLASVIGYSRLQETAEDSEKRKDYGKVVEQASKILLATIDDILDFIRLEDESIRLEAIDFEFQECIENVVAMQAPEAQRKHLRLTCECDDTVPKSVKGDSARLAQIVTNLLSNAIKFTEQGEVRFYASAVYPSHDRVILTLKVTDTGIGIPKSRQPLLFQPFTQADESISRRFGGSGLGLSITRKLAQYMGGDVSLKSDKGEGVEVTVTLNMQLSKPSEWDSQSAPAALSVTNPINALLIEDNELNRKLITIQLQNIGAEVFAVSNGVEALGAIENGSFDVIFMDVHMPGMDGVTLATMFKEHAPTIPLYALTANITGSEGQSLLDIGVRQILYKPLKDDSLRHILVRGLEPDVISQDKDADKGESRLEVSSAVDPYAVLNELQRVLSRIENLLGDSNKEQLQASTQKLLGIARLFTRGKILARSKALEESASLNDTDEAKKQAAALALEIDSLRALQAQAALGSHGNPASDGDK